MKLSFEKLVVDFESKESAESRINDTIELVTKMIEE